MVSDRIGSLLPRQEPRQLLLGRPQLALKPLAMGAWLGRSWATQVLTLSSSSALVRGADKGCNILDATSGPDCPAGRILKVQAIRALTRSSRQDVAWPSATTCGMTSCKNCGDALGLLEHDGLVARQQRAAEPSLCILRIGVACLVRLHHAEHRFSAQNASTCGAVVTLTMLARLKVPVGHAMMEGCLCAKISPWGQ